MLGLHFSGGHKRAHQINSRGPKKKKKTVIVAFTFKCSLSLSSLSCCISYRWFSREDTLPHPSSTCMSFFFAKFTQHAFHLIDCLLSERSKGSCAEAGWLWSLNWNVTMGIVLKWHQASVIEAPPTLDPPPLAPTASLNYSEAHVLTTHEAPTSLRGITSTVSALRGHANLRFTCFGSSASKCAAWNMHEIGNPSQSAFRYSLEFWKFWIGNVQIVWWTAQPSGDSPS